MKKKYYIPVLLLILAACSVFILLNINSIEKVFKNSNGLKESKDKYAFIYSHPFYKKSYLITTEDGKDFHEGTIKVPDLFDMQKNQSEDGNIFLIPTHENALYEINKNGELESRKLQSPLTFIINDKEINITSYNHTINENILEIKEKHKNKTYSLEFPPYLMSAIYDDSNIYLLNALTNKNGSVLHVIDRKKGKVTNSIELNSSAQSLIQVNDEIIISTELSLSIVSIKDNFTIRNLDYPSEGEISPDKLYVQNDQLYLTYGDYKDGSINIWVLDKDNKTIKNQKLDTVTPYAKSKFYNGKLYVLSQNEKGKDGGQFNIFNLTNLKKEPTIYLPKKENVKVQDFIVR